MGQRAHTKHENPDLIGRGGESADEPKDPNDYEDPAVDLPGDDDYVVPMADVGDAQRGQGLDHVGGYGNEPIPQEPGPSQDH
jgi:hypothetical protein